MTQKVRPAPPLSKKVKKSSPPTPKKNDKSKERAWKWTDERLDKLAIDLEDWSDIAGNMLLSKFCADQGIHPGQISRFKEKSPRLCEAVKKAKAKECHMLEGFCLYDGFTDPSGKYRKVNTTGAIFLLKNNHGYTDGRETFSKNNSNEGDKVILKYITKNYAKDGK